MLLHAQIERLVRQAVNDVVDSLWRQMSARSGRSRSSTREARRTLTVEPMESRLLFSALDGSEVVGLPSDMKTSLYTFIGDHSTSNSEKWNMTVGGRFFSAPDYGVVQRNLTEYKKGETYPITVAHNGSNRYVDEVLTPDFDYRAWVDRYATPAWTSGATTVSGPTYFATDSAALLQKRWFGEDIDATVGKTAYLHIPGIDLDIDSDNSASTNRSLVEDQLESNGSSGKVIMANLGDFDGDEVADTIDAYIEGASFEPLSLELSSNVAQASPSQVNLTLTYDAAMLRVWTKDAADSSRSFSDVIASGASYTAASLGLSPGGVVPLFVEALNGSTAFKTIQAAINVTGSVWSGVLSDVVTTAPSKLDLEAAKVEVGENGNQRVAAGVLPEAGGVEDKPGAYVPVNDDDDDYDAANKPDREQQGAIAGEDDLLPVTIKKLQGAPAGGGTQRVLPKAGVKVWKNADRTEPVTRDTQLPLGQDTQVYVEGAAVGASGIRLVYADANGAIQEQQVGGDTLKVNVFKWTGPLNVPEHGIFKYTAGPANLPAAAAWIEPAGGALNVIENPKSVKIKWGAGPVVGRAKLKVDANYTWGLNVNVVEVVVENETAGASASTAGNVVDDGLGQDAGGNTIKKVKADGPGITWAAKVTFNGPNGDRGLRQMRAGFVQELTVTTHRGTYVNGKTAKSQLEGNTYWDTKPNNIDKFYSAAAAGLFEDADTTKKTSVIRDADSPVGGPLKTFLGSTLDSMALAWDFKLYVVALTDETRNDANDVYVGQALGQWKFNATGDVDQTRANLPWTAGAGAGVTAFNAWAAINDGTEPKTTAPRFNDVVNTAGWDEVP